GSSTFIINGNGPQEIYTNSAFHNLTINKESNSVLLQSDVAVNGELNFVLGTIETGDFILTQPSSGIITGASGNTGWVNGNLQKHVATGSTATTFEVGDADHFTPVS